LCGFSHTFRPRQEVPTAVESRMPALTALSAGAGRPASGPDAAAALQAVVETARLATAADLVVVRMVDEEGLVARAVAGSASLAAEIEGSRVDDIPPDEEIDRVAELPAGLRLVAERTGGGATFLVPVRLDGRVVGLLELHRLRGAFGSAERDAARVSAGPAAPLLRAFSPGAAAAPPRPAPL